ncbi:helix-turn-helix domain-containing protein [Devosia sp. FJ2-5-3]|uniref:winged helix-turn-helix transcriptional regulator n=1 Tax=Devosia sp. FJ2-5-3 TaxID=2976680 RepID=UPI0023D80797|nr:helix-turn-helix domain-containing protein [Devosia sp. FJ2-5-3]WEJ58504.1 helix-turn-helix transcriptional regulator [Devosia sp. FJ2-5-3]
MSVSSLPAGHNGNDMLSVKPGKWTLVVIVELREGTLRFSELRRAMGGVSQKSLTTTLRELERDGFISRRAYPTIPPRVDYMLTELGLELLELADGWRQFASRNRSAVEAARHRFDTSHDQFVFDAESDE